MAVEQKFLTGGSDHFDVNVEFLTEEGSAFVSRKLGVESLQGVCRVVSVEEAGADPEVKNYPAAFFDYSSPRRSLTDLEVLAVECLKAKSTDPALRAALLDEAMATTEEADLPVTRDWLTSLHCGFTFDYGDPDEHGNPIALMMVQENSKAAPTKLYFLMDKTGKTSDAWGVVFNNTGDLNAIRSVPTRRKVFAFCLATGIDLMEKS